nr:RHS repeat-associated core domain-containing protein [Knoellia sp. DB2414S]
MLVGLGLGWSGASAGPALTATSDPRTPTCNPAARDTQAPLAPTPHLNQQCVPTRRGGAAVAEASSRHTGAGTAGGEPGVGAVDEAFHAIVTDLVGAPWRLVGPDGSTVWSRSALLWGEPGRVGDLMPLRFPGQFADAETGLVYNVFRYYDPVNARFISSDPLGQVPGPNTYAYVSNPTTLTDPLGLSPCGDAAKFEDGAFRLIGANRATIDPRKLTEYALNPNHPVGGNKARVFESPLGFNRSNADDLMAQQRQGVMENMPIPGKVDKWGTRFTVDIPVTGPGGSGIVRTGWIYTPGSTTPSLNTLTVR